DAIIDCSRGESLSPIAAVDLDGVLAVAAFVEIGAIAGVPDHEIVPRLAEHLVGAGPASQAVVSCSAEKQVVAALPQEDIVDRLTEQQIVSGAADERIVALAPEEVGGRECPIGLGEGDRIITSLSECLDERRRPDRWPPAENGDCTVIDEDVSS